MESIIEQTRLAREAILNLIQSLATKIGDFLPNLIGALIILIVGIIVAAIVRGIFRRILNTLGLNYIAEKSGINHLLEKIGTKKKATDLLASLIYLAIILIFFVAATETLGIRIVIDTVNKFIAYLPKVFGALFIFIFLSYIAKVIGNVIKNFLISAEIEYATIIGTVVEVVIDIFALVMALRELGFDTTIFTANITLFIGIFLGAIGLALGLGGKSIAEKILAGFYLKSNLKVGDQIDLEKVSGRIKAITSAYVSLETPEGEEVLLPTDEVLKQAVKKK